MRRQRERVRPERRGVAGRPAGKLDGVAEHAAARGMGERRGLGDRLDHAGFIVCSPAAPAACVPACGRRFDPVEVDPPVRAQRRDLHRGSGKTASVEDARVFARADDQSLERRFLRSDAEAGVERRVGRLGAAGDESDRPRGGAAEARHLGAGVLDDVPGRPALGVDRRRVAAGVHRGERGFPRLRAERRGRVMVEIGPCRRGGHAELRRKRSKRPARRTRLAPPFFLAISGALRAMRRPPRRAPVDLIETYARRPRAASRVPEAGPAEGSRPSPMRASVCSGVLMPEVFFNGPAGRLEGRFHPAKQRGAPIAIVLHPHPQFGGTMNNQIVYSTYYNFAERGFSVLRFNFRGVGRSQGAFDHGQGELSDAASALDWAQSISPEARACWIAGVSFGSWIGMQLLMRRPEIEGFISIAPPANRFDFSFLAPCPSSGLFVHGDKDRVAPLKEVLALIEKLKTQRGIVIEHAVIPEANHFFEDCVDDLQAVVGAYLDKRLGMPRHAPQPLRKERAKPAPPQRRKRIADGDRRCRSSRRRKNSRPHASEWPFIRSSPSTPSSSARPPSGRCSAWSSSLRRARRWRSTRSPKGSTSSRSCG